MKFAIIGNIYQTEKSLHAEHLLGVLRHYKAKILVEKAFAEFLLREQHLNIPVSEQFEGIAFEADMVISSDIIRHYERKRIFGNTSGYARQDR